MSAVLWDFEKDVTPTQNMASSPSDWMLYFLCLHVAKQGLRIAKLAVAPRHWTSMCQYVVDRRGVFSFDGERGIIECAPVGYKVRIHVDERLGETEWRYWTEPMNASA